MKVNRFINALKNHRKKFNKFMFMFDNKYKFRLKKSEIALKTDF